MLVKTGSTSGGVLLLSGTSNSWSGGTQVNAGTINVASGSSLSTGAVTMAGTTTSVNTSLVLNNTSQTITSLSSSFIPTSGTQTQTVSLASGHTLTLNQSTNTTFGVGTVSTQNSIISGAGAMVKTGSGRLTLTSSGTYFTGGLTITDGEIRFNPFTNTNITFNSPVTLNGGLLSTTGTSSTATITCNTLNLAASSSIDLGTSTSHSVKFAASNGVSWTSATVLNITGWQGAFNGTAGTKGRLFIGTSATGVTTTQLAQIQFTDGSGNVFPAVILSTGEIVPKASITTTAASYGPYSNATSNSLSVAFTTSGPFTGSFRVQLSNASGTFSADTTTNIIGVGSASPISATIPAATASGAGYRVRVVNGSPAMIFGSDNGSNIVVLAPSPTISSFSPATGIPGSSVTITGTNFNTTAANNIVYFGATTATVSSASATSLSVTLPTDATYTPITVLNTGLQLSGAATSPYLPGYTTTYLTSGEINFQNAQNFAAGSSPFGAIVGDLDGDGKSDMLVVNSNSSTISVYRNTSAAGSMTATSFASPVTLTTASTPTNLHLADIDGDGKLDIIVVEAAAAAVSVFRNTSTSGAISLASRSDFSTTASGLAPIEVTVADFDGDGRPDLAVSSSYSSTIIVLQNASSVGSVSFATGVSFAANTNAFGITTADFDGDNKPDIAVVDSGAAKVSVFRNTSSAGVINSSSFAAAVDFTTGATPIDVEVADIDGDGKMDIITSNSSSNTISVLRNTATSGAITSGSFATKVDFTTDNNPTGLAVGDIDGDGKVDIAVSNSTSNNVSVYRNLSSSGSISLHSRANFNVGSNPEGMSIGDVDGDNKPDIIVGNLSSNSVSVLRNYRQPNVSAIAGGTSVCIGGTTTFSDVTAGGTWSVTNTSLATVDGSGGVTGLAVGTDTLMYTVVVSRDSTTVQLAFTVNPASGAGAISGAGSVCQGSDITLTIGAAGGTWSSSNATVASVNSSGGVHGASSGTATISYILTSTCGSDTAYHSVTVNPLPNAGAISGAGSACTGATATLTTSGTGGSWSTTDASVASVDTSGVVTGVGAGAATISYTVINGCGTDAATQSFTVITTPVAGTISGASTLCTGVSGTFTSSGTGGGTWTSSNTSVASVNSASGSVTAISAGSATITYSVSNSCGSNNTTQGITVNTSPNAGTVSGTSPLCAGASATYTSSGATGGSWTSSNSAVASVNSSTGSVYGSGSGSATITYTISGACGSNSATQDITVNTAPSAGTVSGTSPLCVAASATYTSGGTTGGSWTSSNTSIASVNGSTGSVTGVGAGSATITYTVSNTCGSNTSTQGLTVTPLPSAGTMSGANTVCAASATTLTASGAAGGTWSSTNTAAATVSGGVVYGVSGGTTTISYTVTNSCGTDAATQSMTVTPLAVSGTISGATSVCEGANTTLTSSGLAGGTWSSSSPGVATVDTGGSVHGVAAGGTTITYTVTDGCGSNYSTSAMTVNPAPNAGSLSGPASVCVAASVSVTRTGGGGGGTWSTSNASIATAAGSSINGVAAGSVTVSYSVTNGCGTDVSTLPLIVNGTPSAGAISGATAVCTGSNTTLTISGTGGAWSSDNIAVATVSSAGVVHGLTNGSVNISYYVSTGCGTSLATQAMTVITTPNAGTVSGAAVICTGNTTTFTTTGDAGGSWTSANSSVATVDGSGNVTGAFVGTTSISYSVTNSCGTISSTHAINVSPSPNAGTITGAATVCQGANVNLTNTASGGTWSTSASSTATASATGIVHGVTAGSVTVTYTVSSACGSAYTTFPMTVIPAAISGTISGSVYLCTGASASLFTTTGTTGGTWSIANTALATVDASGIVTPISTGVTAISYFVTNACGSQTSTKPVTVTSSPYVAPITGSSNVGTGGAITLYETSGGGAWSSSDTTICKTSVAGSVFGIAPGTATISYTVTNACGTVAATKAVTSRKLFYTNGSSETVNMCTNNGAYNLNIYLPIYEQYAGRTLHWTRVTAPNHGTASVSYTATSVAGTNTPLTTAYTPSGSYAGTDSFIIAVSDGTNTDTEMVYIVMHPVDANPTVSGPASVCVGSSITLSGTPSGGTWSSNSSAAVTFTAGGVVTGLSGSSSPVMYYHTTNIWGCISSRSYPVTVNVPGLIGGISGTNSNICPGSSIQVNHLVPGGTWGISDPTKATIAAIYAGSDTARVTGIGSGRDTVLYTLTNSCGTLTARWPVNMPSSVPPNISGPNTPICIGNVAYFTDGTPGGTWSSSNTAIATVSASGTVYATGAGTATISYGTTACGTTGYVGKSITVNPTPSAGTISGPSSVIVNHNISLVVSGAVGAGNWASTNNSVATVSATGSIVRGVAAGSDTIKFTVSNTCGTSIAIFPLSVTASRSENGNAYVTSNEENSGIKLYPNPATGLVTLEVEGQAGTTTMFITDLSGRTVITRETEANQLSVDMRQLPAGMYLVKVNTGGKTYFEKLILQ